MSNAVELQAAEYFILSSVPVSYLVCVVEKSEMKGSHRDPKPFEAGCLVGLCIQQLSKGHLNVHACTAPGRILFRSQLCPFVPTQLHSADPDEQCIRIRTFRVPSRVKEAQRSVQPGCKINSLQPHFHQYLKTTPTCSNTVSTYPG